MGQFDLETDAVLAQLNYEELSKTPGGEFVEIIGDLIALTGVAGPLAIAGGASNFALKVRKLAGASYASNLIFAISAVRNDLADLYRRPEKLRGRIDFLPTDPRFVEAISALALRAMHTSVKDRLKRLARIVVNGVKDNDLEPESLDDMMRAVVELKEYDLKILKAIYNLDLKFFSPSRQDSDSKYVDAWKKNSEFGSLQARSALVRLQAHGFIYYEYQNRPAGEAYLPHSEPHFLTDDGKKFYERLQEIGTTE